MPDLNLLAGLCASFAGLFTIAFSLVSVVFALHVLRREGGADDEDAYLPPVSILKPLKGRDEGLYRNLASFCGQDYPRFELIFALEDPKDPAREVVERLQKDFPSVDIKLVVSSGRVGCNPKINNLSNAYPSVRYDTVVISDSDIRVSPCFLRTAVRPLRDPEVGIVTCFYRAARARGVWGRMEELAVNAHFLPQALTAAALGFRFAMGATILVRRSAFERAGGFKNLADHIADDYVLGRDIQRAGYRLAFAEAVVDVIPEARTYADHVRHQIREHRVIRLCKSSEYLGIVLLHGFSLLTLKALVLGPDVWTLSLLAAVWCAKAFSIVRIQSLLGGGASLASLALIPLSEWTAFGAWVCGFGYKRVLWRGVFYSIQPNGKLIPVRTSLASQASS